MGNIASYAIISNQIKYGNKYKPISKFNNKSHINKPTKNEEKKNKL